MNMAQKMNDKENSIKQLRIQLQHLTEDLNKTTAQLQLMEISDMSNSFRANSEAEQEISKLIRKQNTISHEIITVRKRIQRLSAKTILKVELLVLPILCILSFYVVTNYSIYYPDQTSPIKTRYLVENLRGSTTDNYEYWDIKNGTPLIVNIENYAQVGSEKINAVKKAILSTDMVTGDSSLFFHSVSGSKSEYFKGWQGAVKYAGGVKHYIPEKFDVVESPNGIGDIVITLSSMSDAYGYSGITKTIVDEKQILKAFITIYDSNKLTDDQIESIVRHEFGHALGLPHTSNPEDLMHDTIKINSYISECDINTLKKLYNDSKPTEDFCSS